MQMSSGKNRQGSKMKKLVALVTIVALSGVLITPSANALGTPKPQQIVSWAWEDGVDKGHRDFSEDDFDTAADMPALMVTVSPASTGRRVILETYDVYLQTWSQEISTRTNAAGIAKLQADPNCSDEYGSAPAWCDHDKTYRIRVLKSGTQKVLVSKPFAISFVASEEATF
jgi:hypothetical protein